MALEAMARAFTSAMQLKKCSLLFDDTKRKVEEANFEVYSSRPTFVTSDDALVECAKQGSKAVFVTSDRELIERLTEQGGTICSPKTWFGFAARVLSGDAVENLDVWAEQFIVDESQLSMDVESKLRV